MPEEAATAPTPPSSAANALFKDGDCRVGYARVDVAGAGDAEQRRGVFAVFKNVGNGLVDRGGPGPGRRVGFLAAMQCQSAGSYGLGNDTHEAEIGSRPRLIDSEPLFSLGGEVGLPQFAVDLGHDLEGGRRMARTGVVNATGS